MKPAPLIEVEFTITTDVPVDVSVSDCVVEVFTVTLPKFRLAALTVNCGFAATAVPFKTTVAILPLVELLLIVSCPVTAPAEVGKNCTCSVTDWLGFSVTGKLPATIAKPAPVIDVEFTVTGEVPVDVSVNTCVVAEFTATLPKLRFDELTVNCGFALIAPVPLRDTRAVPPVVEVLLIVSCPDADPAEVGWNCTCSVITWLGFNVSGNPPPGMEKPAPVIEAELTITGEVPVDVSVNTCVVVEFTVTLPKLRFDVLTVNCGSAGGAEAAAVPVPLRATTAVPPPLVELLLMAICPTAAPATAGWNCTCSVTVCVGFNVNGRLTFKKEKPAPVIDAELTVTGEVPVDVSINICVVAALTVTLPKLRFEVLTNKFSLSPDPHPEVANARQNATAKTKAAHQQLH